MLAAALYIVPFLSVYVSNNTVFPSCSFSYLMDGHFTQSGRLPIGNRLRTTRSGAYTPIPLSTWISLNFVRSLIASISVMIWSISSWIFCLSAALFVPFDAWTDNSMHRSIISCTSVRAPSAICIMEMPSSEFADACVSPRICLRIFSDMLKPAASSAALFTLYPLESFSADFPRIPSVMPNWRSAFIALILCCILMTIILLDILVVYNPSRITVFSL